MANLFVNETWVNATKGYQIGDSDVYESFTDNPGELFRSLQSEYGRCVSKMYSDSKEGTKCIGWVFEKRQKYDDCNETYLAETWVSIHDVPPVKSIQYQYHELAA